MYFEKFNKRICKFFEDSGKAFYKLDSICYYASEKIFSERIIREHIKDIVRISLSYSKDQLKALGIIEKIYIEGLTEKESAISINNQGKKNYQKDDIIKKLYNRLKKCKENGNNIALIGLENIANEVILDFEFKKIPFSGTGLVYRQRVGK